MGPTSRTLLLLSTPLVACHRDDTCRSVDEGKRRAPTDHFEVVGSWEGGAPIESLAAGSDGTLFASWVEEDVESGWDGDTYGLFESGLYTWNCSEWTSEAWTDQALYHLWMAEDGVLVAAGMRTDDGWGGAMGQRSPIDRVWSWSERLSWWPPDDVGARRSNDVVVVGARLLVRFQDGEVTDPSEWERSGSYFDSTWVGSDGIAWAAGYSGGSRINIASLARVDGFDVEYVDLPTPADEWDGDWNDWWDERFFSIRGSSPDNIWITGRSSGEEHPDGLPLLFSYDGVSWTTRDLPIELLESELGGGAWMPGSLAVAAPDEVYLEMRGGQYSDRGGWLNSISAVIRWNGEGWTLMSGIPTDESIRELVIVPGGGVAVAVDHSILLAGGDG
jgi:hypothetical protein